MEKEQINRKENRGSEPSTLAKTMSTDRTVAMTEKKSVQSKYRKVNHLYKLL